MSRFRDFDAARAEAQGDPLRFRLAGREFTIERVPAGPLLRLAAKSNLQADTLAALDALGEFLVTLVVEDQRDAMRAAVDDADFPTLLNIVRWVTEEATAVPLDEPSDSAEPSSDDGETSRVVSLSPAKVPRSA